ncbi:YciI family protein [Arthrobacter sp. TMT4-20]
MRGGSVGMADGPYPETAERLGGFSLVETDDPEALAEFVNELLADTTGPAESRAIIRPREGS